MLFIVEAISGARVNRTRKGDPGGTWFLHLKVRQLRNQDTTYQVWLPVIGRALSYLCMHNADMGSKAKGEKARFLEAIGLERKDVAEMLGTTYASITELMSQAKKKNRKGAKKSAIRKAKGR